MSAKSELLAHMATGATTVCRTWSVLRKDGAIYGFTDHDRDLAFEGITFKASSGMTARALQQSTGLSVDNTEALGALSAAAISEADLMAGRFDGAEVRSWLVNWADVGQRIEQFRGSFGEIKRSAGTFLAELRGLTETLNQPQGRVYHRSCAAVLGDAQCGVNLGLASFAVETALLGIDDQGAFSVAPLAGFGENWFDRGRLIGVSGAASGLVAQIKTDRPLAGARRITLWAGLGAMPGVGDVVRLEAGCDKMAETCRSKFGNFLNFRGFPHIPGEDWLTSYPVSSQINDGGSMAK